MILYLTCKYFSNILKRTLWKMIINCDIKLCTMWLTKTKSLLKIKHQNQTTVNKVLI